jgi:fatty acid desaturase
MSTREVSIPGEITPARGRVSIEWPTLLLIVAVYAGWLLATAAYGNWSGWLVIPVLATLVTLHGSLQHEIVHNHPTRWNGINKLFGIIPLSLWLPYMRYRQTHRQHHIDERLTDPLDDPESYYWTPEDWKRVDPVTRLFLDLQQTLAGRIVIGSFWTIGKFLRAEVRAIRADVQGVRATWLEHLLWCVPVLLWLTLVCHMPLWLYFLGAVLPANGIQLIRSFAEHRAGPKARERVAIVEGSWLLGPLFLFNNLHSLHHESPGVPWYQYNSRYRRIRDRLIAENGGLVYSSYVDVARRYLFRAHDSPQHPTGRVPFAP